MWSPGPLAGPAPRWVTHACLCLSRGGMTRAQNVPSGFPVFPTGDITSRSRTQTPGPLGRPPPAHGLALKRDPVYNSRTLKPIRDPRLVQYRPVSVSTHIVFQKGTLRASLPPADLFSPSLHPHGNHPHHTRPGIHHEYLFGLHYTVRQ